MQNTIRDRLIQAMDRAEADYLAAIRSVARGEPGAARRLAEAKVAMECREHSTIEIGTNRLVVGIVHRVHVRDGILDPESLRLVDGAGFAPIGRMASPDWYARTGDRFRMS